jgi:hypothetical protein
VLQLEYWFISDQFIKRLQYAACRVDPLPAVTVNSLESEGSWLEYTSQTGAALC